MSLEGGTDWISTAIKDSSLVKVTDGSYTRQLYPFSCSTAFVLECSKGRGKLIGSFSEETLAANTYRGELLGLMAVHLLLFSVNRIDKLLKRLVEVVSDCLGALSRVVISRRIGSPPVVSLMNILVNCRDLTFSVHYSHVKAHQDDTISFDKLTWKSQLNCICDHLAKQRISESAKLKHQPSSLFPLEPIGIFIAGAKLSSYPGQQMQSHAHRQLATRLCIPTEFRRIPAEFRQKAPAGTECDRNRPEQAPECAIV
jgi:hypothetical protein